MDNAKDGKIGQFIDDAMILIENINADTGRKPKTSHFQGFLKKFGVWFVFKITKRNVTIANDTINAKFTVSFRCNYLHSIYKNYKDFPDTGKLIQKYLISLYHISL